MGILTIGMVVALSGGATGNGKPSDPKALAILGAREYADGRYADAERDLAAAFNLHRVPILLFNIGQCERAQGHFEKAIFFYSEYIASAPDAPNLALVRRKLQEVQAQDAKAKSILRPERKPDLSPEEPTSGTVADAPVAPTPRRTAPSLQPKARPRTASEEAALLAALADAAGPELQQQQHVEHSHWAGATFLTAAAICAGFAIYGAVRVIQYDQIPYPAQTMAQYGDRLALYENAQNWGTAAIALGVAAAGGTTGAILTW